MKKTVFKHLLFSFLLAILINVPLGFVAIIPLLSQFRGVYDFAAIGIFFLVPIITFPVALIIASVITYKHLFKNEFITNLQKVFICLFPELLFFIIGISYVLFSDLYIKTDVESMKRNAARMEKEDTAKYYGKISIDKCHHSLIINSEGILTGVVDKEVFIECQINSNLDDNLSQTKFFLDGDIYESGRFSTNGPIERVNTTPEQYNKNTILETYVDGKRVYIGGGDKEFLLPTGTHIIKFKFNNIYSLTPAVNMSLSLNDMKIKTGRGVVAEVARFNYETSSSNP